MSRGGRSWWLFRPWVLFALGVYVVVNAKAQPAAGRERTVVGEVLNSPRLRTGCVFPNVDVVAVPNGLGGWTVGQLGQVSDPEFSKLGEVEVSRWRSSTSWGFWSCIVEERGHVVNVRDISKGWALVPTAGCGGLFDAIEAKIPGSFPMSSRVHDLAGGHISKRVLWWGVINDLSVMLSLEVLAFGLVHHARR